MKEGAKRVYLDSKLCEKKHAAYVLITCDEPNLEGKMQVELTFDGDPSLASYLLESAQQFIDEDKEKSMLQ
jgi:hypothetical protein